MSFGSPSPQEDDPAVLGGSAGFGPGQAPIKPSDAGRDAADRLQDILERAESWPVWSANRVGGIDTGTYAQVGMYGKSARDIALWQALRENDREQLVKLTGWQADRKLHVDPLPERISTAYSDLLYGEEPDFLAADDGDQDNMKEMTDEMGLADQLRQWVDISVSEGEVWWRMWTDIDASEWPMVSGHSRLEVIPLFAGHKIMAAAFVDTIFQQELQLEKTRTMMYWRHVEIHAMGHVRNLLYYGSIGALGERKPLDSLVETQDLEENWDHNLPLMLAGRVPNKIGRDFRLGISEFQGVQDLLMDLNEARTIMAENARLVLKARMVIPASAVGPDGRYDASEDVIIAEAQDDELGSNKNGPYTVLEYKFPSGELIAHKHELTLDILARCGLAEQFVQESRGGSGQAYTGTALRTRLIPTTLAASGKARKFDRAVPQILRAAVKLSALDVHQGGCGCSWQDTDTLPIQQRSTVLPEDENEQVQRNVMAVQGEIESIQTAVEDLHGDEWDDERIELEVARIRADRSALGPTYAATGTDPDTIATMDIPNTVPGGPNSAVADPRSVLGSEQPGVTGTSASVDGQSPGGRSPQVTAGGPK